MAALNMESTAWRHEWSTEGEQRRRTLGALKDDLNKINASWELTASSLSTALVRSAQRSDHALSSTGPGNRGAPRSVASLTLPLTNDSKQSSFTDRSWCAMSSHFDVPVCLFVCVSEYPTILLLATSLTVTGTHIPYVITLCYLHATRYSRRYTQQSWYSI